MTKAEFDHVIECAEDSEYAEKVKDDPLRREISRLAAALEAAEKERDSLRDHLSVNLQRLDAARDYIDKLEKDRAKAAIEGTERKG